MIASPDFWTRTEPESKIARKAEAGSHLKVLRDDYF